MSRFALLIYLPFFFFLQTVSTSGQPIVTTPVIYLNNRYVDFKLTQNTNPNSAFFYLFDDGHFSIQKEPTHQYHNTSSYTTQVFAASPYSVSLPSKQVIGINPISNTATTGSSTANSFLGNKKLNIGESWSAAEGYELIYILSFAYPCSTVQNTPISGALEFHMDQDISMYSFYNPRTDWSSPGIYSPSGSTEPGCNDKITWHFYNLTPGEVRHVYIHVSIPQGLNKAALSSVAKTIMEGSPNCNVTESKLTMLKRYPHDPNGMSVNFQEIPPALSESRKLKYTVYFQNSGNYYAEDVLINTFFNGPIDINNINVLSSSAPVTNITSNSNGLSFLMDNHRLPGSNQTFPYTYSYDQTTGFIEFTLCTNPYLAMGDKIEGHANIVFDTQPEIMTNTVKTTIADNLNYVLCSSTDDHLMNIHSDSNADPADNSVLNVSPNPSSGYINIEYEVAGSQDSPVSISIYNLSGQRLSTPLYQSIKAPGNHNLTVDISNFPSGPLVIEVQTSNNTSRYQIIKS